MQEQILGGQGVWGKGERDSKVLFLSDTFLPQFGQQFGQDMEEREEISQ